MPTFNGYIGNKSKRLVRVFTHGCYYVQEGGTIVNEAANEYALFEDGTHLDDIEDIDAFTWDKPIWSEEELIEAVQS